MCDISLVIQTVLTLIVRSSFILLRFKPSRTQQGHRCVEVILISGVRVMENVKSNRIVYDHI